MKQELVDFSDEVWRRLRARLDGLTDAEYFWEPAPGCWTIRVQPDGRWRADWPLPRPDPEPFTTIAWRLWHLIDMYGENRAPEWLDVPAQGPAIGLDDPQGSPPGTAADALLLLERAHDRWDAHLALVTEESLASNIGAAGAGYADHTRASYVLHMLDEYVHHGAEISLLRDLWRWQHPLGVSSDIERAIRGDDTVVDAITDADSDEASELMRVAAAYARWPLVRALVDAGVRVGSDGVTPLHLAAGAGELGTVQLLVAHGANVTARDPQFNATPIEWAQFLKQGEVADWLASAP